MKRCCGSSDTTRMKTDMISDAPVSLTEDGKVLTLTPAEFFTAERFERRLGELREVRDRLEGNRAYCRAVEINLRTAQTKS